MLTTVYRRKHVLNLLVSAYSLVNNLYQVTEAERFSPILESLLFVFKLLALYSLAL